MNWVGGARSRVRQQADKKMQKDFFERKKLASKLQQFRPSLSKVKTSISQDLLFLKTTAASTKSRPLSPVHPPKKPLSLEPERAGGQKGCRAAAGPCLQRDLELPMSPIGRSSMLDIMDTSVAPSEGCEEELWREGGVRGVGLPAVVGDGLPRVSTQKIPRKTLLESFGPPKIEEFNIQANTACDPHTVPAMDPHLLNISTMTESLFPPPAKRHKQQNMGRNPHEKAPSFGPGQFSRKATKYSLDDILNQKHTGITGDRGKDGDDVTKPSHQPALARHVPSNQGKRKKEEGVRMVRNKRDNHEFLFEVAKGKFQQDKTIGSGIFQQGLNKKSQLGYDFESWVSAAGKKQKKQQQQKPRHQPQARAAGGGGDGGPLAGGRGVEVVSSEDGEAVLEFHYAPAPTEKKEREGPERGRGRGEGGRRGQGNLTENDKQELNQLVPIHGIGPEPSHEGTNAPKGENVVPWLSSAKSTVSVLSEDPFSRRKLPPIYVGPPVSTSMDFNESIFGPLCQQAGRADRGRKSSGEPGDQSATRHSSRGDGSSLDATVFDESVLVPILATRKGAAVAKEKVGSERRLKGEVVGGEPVEKRGKEEVKLGGKAGEEGRHGSDRRSLSTFEKMMASLEQSSCSESTRTDTSDRGHSKDLDRHDPTEKAKSSMGDAPSNSNLPPLPPAIPHDSTATSECASLPESGSIQALPGEGSRRMPGEQGFKYKFGNISVLNELMCLEEEISSHYEDGLLSQNSPEEFGNSEDPLFNRPPVCENGSSTNAFLSDCSQDSIVKPDCMRGTDTTENEAGDDSTGARQTAEGCSGVETGVDSSALEVQCTVSTQTDLDQAGGSESVPDNFRPGKVLAKSVQTDLEQCCLSTQTSVDHKKPPSCPDIVSCSSSMGDNLTVALDRYDPCVVSSLQKNKSDSALGMTCNADERKKMPAPNENLTVPVCTKSGDASGISPPPEKPLNQDSVITSPSPSDDTSPHKLEGSGHVPCEGPPQDTTYVAGYEARIQDLEEKLAMAESTIVWQSVMLKAYKTDSE